MNEIEFPPEEKIILDDKTIELLKKEELLIRKEIEKETKKMFRRITQGV